MRSLTAAYRWFAARSLSVDARSLGLFRVAFGVLCLANLYDRVAAGGFLAFYTDAGILTTRVARLGVAGHRGWSFLFAVGAPWAVGLALGAVAAVYALYTLGWKTHVMKVLVAACLVSLDSRVLILQSGGHVVMNLLAVWTMFLPVGARFSLDSLRASLRGTRERSAGELRARAFAAQRPTVIARWPFFFLCLQFAAIYFFNTVQKTGATWRGGSAVHHVLWLEQNVTGLASWLRMHEPPWLSPVLSGCTLLVEGALPILILSPWQQRLARPAAITLAFALHGGIALVIMLGPFSYAMMSFALLLVTPGMWAWLGERPVRRAFTLVYDDADPAAHALVRVLVRLDGAGAVEVIGRSERTLLPATLPDVEPRSPFLVHRDGQWHRGRAARGAVALVRVARLFGVGRVDRHGDLPREVSWLGRAADQARRVQDGLATIVLIVVASELLLENPAVPQALRPVARPAWMAALVDGLHLHQGWSMFAPDVPTESGTLVVDAELSDGTHVDPLTGRAPDFEALLHGPRNHDQQWCQLHLRGRSARYLWPSLRDYLWRGPEPLHGHGEPRVVRLAVYGLSSRTPPLGETGQRDFARSLFFSSERPGAFAEVAR